MRHLQLTAMVSVALLCGATGLARADITLLKNANHEISIYGFVKLDATYQSDPTNSLIAPRFATGGRGSATDLTATQSRFGFKWKGPSLENGYQTGAVLEFDLFDPTTSNQMEFRTRLAALTLSRDTTTWLFGQHWDVFSPLNPTTLMTNGNLWQTGNLGFRRAQVRYSRTGKTVDWAVSANDPSTSGTAPNTDAPIIEGRVGFAIKRAKIGISGAFGDDETTIPNQERDISGLSVDWSIPLGERLSLIGEAADGENLAVFISRSSVNATTQREQDVTAFWTELVYTAKRYNWWVGIGSEELDDSALAVGANEDTRVIFAGLQWKLKGAVLAGSPVLFGVEIARFQTDLAGGGDNTANQVMFSAIYNF